MCLLWELFGRAEHLAGVQVRWGACVERRERSNRKTGRKWDPRRVRERNAVTKVMEVTKDENRGARKRKQYDGTRIKKEIRNVK